jgi:membrane protein implicated in regulation of membrane protease activity
MIGNLVGMLIMIEAMIMLLMMIHMLCLHLVLLLFMVEVGLGEIMLLLMPLEKFAIVLLLFSILAILPLYFYVRMQK